MTLNKSIFFSLWVVLICSSAYAQTDKINDLLKQGRVEHSKGNFNEAIAIFQQALKIDSQHTIATYELANSYYSNKEYEKALKFSQKVIEKNKRYLLAAYLLTGSCLTDMGRLPEANEVFEKAAQKYTHHYLIQYNLGINHYTLKNYGKALKYAQKSAFIKPMHASSHLLLAALNEIKGSRIKAAMSYYFFLLLEPGSPRSVKALVELKGLLKIIMNNEGGSIPSSDPFLMTKHRLAQVDLSRKRNESNMDEFVNKTKFFFKTLGSVNRKTPYPSVWGDMYAPLFYRLGRSRHITPYCYFIHQKVITKEVRKWNKEKKNQKSTVSFQYWMGKQLSSL
ncbi:tetratricopeptide repeat protein [uncultured Microscilla sp.]|uniref:tetratricopeptide repeat protein n=1 Tax=uncultured Microscilla sp. TaxID=432653 RepID=UPI0026283577|nr:tetratricopeptide repeat protein [uncultured Microscilla sp.]